MEYVDPPEGWKYGFPKPYFHNQKTNVEGVGDHLGAWLIENGYPAEYVDSKLHRYCKFFYHTYVVDFQDGLLTSEGNQV